MLEKTEYYLQLAYKQAEIAYRKGEVPVGVIIVRNETIIARAHNQKEKLKSSLGHAEIIAIQQNDQKAAHQAVLVCTCRRACLHVFFNVILPHVGLCSNSPD